MNGRSSLVMGFLGWCMAMFAVPADAAMMYSFRVESPNYTYTSVITIGSMTGPDSWRISDVTSAGVLSPGGPVQNWNGSASNSAFSWNDLARQLHVSYSVAGTSFSMTLPNARFVQGTTSEGLPLGSMLGGVGTTSDPPSLSYSGSTYQWVTSSVQYFQQQFGSDGGGNPVPAEGALLSLAGFGLARIRRRRSA